MGTRHAIRWATLAIDRELERAAAKWSELLWSNDPTGFWGKVLPVMERSL